MKKFIKFFCFGILMLISLAFLVPNSEISTTKTSSAASVESNFYDAVKVIESGQILSANNFLTIDDETYLYTNNAISFVINPFEYNYYDISAQTDTSYYVEQKKLTLSTDENSFEYEGKTYYYSLSVSTGVLNFYNTEIASNVSPSSSSNVTDAISFQNNDGTLTLTFDCSYTLLASASDSQFEISISRGTSRPSTASTSLINIIRPIINFSNASNEIVEFSTYSDSETLLETNDTIQKEQVFEQIKIEFVEKSYTKNNPLYFCVNYNGFSYYYELYSEEFDDGETYLFVNYFDENNEENDKFLASSTNSDNELISENAVAKNQTFSLFFTETGRYSLEIYDSTYLCGLSDANYYSTTFYIVDGSTQNSSFDNIYMIAQTLRDDGTEIEYIVSDATVNYNVLLTIKNLTNIGENELEDVVSGIKLYKVLFGGSNNIPYETTYSPAEISSMIDKNGNLTFSFQDDAYYQIYIYSAEDSSKYIVYSFSLVKQPKTTFTISYDNVTDSASEPYKTEIKNYSHLINSSLIVTSQISFQDNAEIAFQDNSITLNKSYVNEYEIYYGMEQVLIEGNITYSSENDDVSSDYVTFEFYGVGDLTVTVTINDQTTTYSLNYENGNYTLTFSEYGTYTVYLIDAMGSSTSKVLTMSKGLSTSAILLIVLSCVLAAFVIFFIVRIRAGIKTR